jgi:hypothetical protein
LVFDADGARAESIRDEDEYSGVRVTLPCCLDRAVLRFHVEVNVGDPIRPDPVRVVLPRVLGNEPLEVLGYPLATVLAEKLVTAVERGSANTRWRDFADVYLLTRTNDQRGGELVTSITTVAEHRKIQVMPLDGALSGLPNLAQPRWAAWRRKQLLDHLLPADFAEVLAAVVRFADPCLGRDSAPGNWSALDGRWT